MGKFTVNDLKSGYLIQLRNGDFYMVGRSNQSNFTKIAVTKTNHLFVLLDHYDNNLKMKNQSNLDIMKVYGLPDFGYQYLLFLTDDRPLLWERKEVKKMTIADIEKLLGYDIEIVREK